MNQTVKEGAEGDILRSIWLLQERRMRPRSSRQSGGVAIRQSRGPLTTGLSGSKSFTCRVCLGWVIYDLIPGNHYGSRLRIDVTEILRSHLQRKYERNSMRTKRGVAFVMPLLSLLLPDEESPRGAGTDGAANRGTNAADSFLPSSSISGAI